MNKQLFTVLTFVKINTKRFFRDRTAIFFTIGFPLIFLFVFGNIFGGSSGDTSFKVALINQSNSEFAKEFVKDSQDNKVLKIDANVTSLDAAKDKMNRSELDAAIVLPSNFGSITEKNNQSYPSGQAQVYYTQNNQSAGTTLSSVLSEQFNGINAKYVDLSVPFTVKPQQTNDNSLSQFDYTFAGLLGFAIIGMGIFGPINVFPELKKMGILRRLSTTPLKVWQYFLSTMIGQAVIGLVALAAMFLVAIFFFHLKVVGNYAELALFLIFGIIMILGIGLALGGWAKNERQVAPLSNIIVFPMMFLSGTFFPRFLMPDWLQVASSFLPLTPVIDGARLIITEGRHLVELGPQLGIMAVWTVVIYFIAFKVFRWE